ncbi:MAG: aldehyde dehydrogenase family protein [Polyangiales bacterium]
MSTQTPGHLIDGHLCEPAAPDGEVASRCPADLSLALRAQPYAVSSLDAAVDAARRAARPWAALSMEARVQHVTRFRDVLAAHVDEVARAIALEVGKVLREGEAEARAMLAKVDIAVGEGLALVRDEALDGGRMGWRWRPHGVLAVIGPFNFPLHLAHGHVVPALLAGNAVVFKPSEVTPACGALYARLAQLAALPPGVLNVVHGEATVGARLSSHPGVDGVLFTGSYAVGRRILEANAAEPGRMIALELGGVNHAVVLADAPFEKAVADVALSAFLTSGQRCTCASRVVVERAIADRFVEALATVAREVRVGHPLDGSAFMGPLASEAALRRFAAVEAMAEAEGVALVEAPREISVSWEGRDLVGCYAAPRVRRVSPRAPDRAWRDTEVFGPSVAVWVVDDLDEALAVANGTDYGLAAGVWTASEASFERFANEVGAGSVTWNAPTAGASSRLPFGGVKRSGNHRPAGVFSSRYCAWPMAYTKGAAALDPATLPPGLPREAIVKA